MSAANTSLSTRKVLLTGPSRGNGTGILVSQICPGGVLTEFGDIDPETKDQSWLRPEAIAEAVAMIIEFRGLGWMRDLTIVPEPVRR